MKRFNFPLAAGSLIILCILVFMFFPEMLTPKSPYNLQSIRSRVEQGVLEFQNAPYPPASDFPLGSDEFGRDIWCHIVYGSRLTIILSLLIVAGRFLIALPMALSAGFGNSLPRSIIKQFSLLFSAIPALLISIIILKQDVFLNLDKTKSVMAFVIVLSLVGWAKLGNLLLERTQDVMRQPFIRSETALGKRRIRIALENVIPHLLAEMVVLFFMEIAAALSLLMQLGIFGVYVGNLRIIRDTQGGIISYFNISFEPEWASMLGTARNMIHVAPWMVIFPALAFFIAVLGFNFLGEGFRILLQKSGTRSVSVFRSLLDPRTRISRIRMNKTKLMVGGIPAFLLLLLLSGHNVFNSGQFDSLLYDRQSLPEAPVIAGSPGAAATASLISKKMTALGLESLTEPSQLSPSAHSEAFFFDYPLDPVSIPEESECIFGSGNTVYTIGEDYSFLALSSYRREGAVYDASGDDLLNIQDFSLYDDVFVLIDKEYYSDESLQFIIEQLGDHASPLGILLASRSGENLTNSIAREDLRFFIMLLTREMAASLAENPDSDLSVRALAKRFGGHGRNIAGIRRGTDPDLEDEVILFVLGYNYKDEPGRDILGFNLSLMESICRDIQNRRSYIFFFLDGTLNEEQHGLPRIMNRFPYNSSDIKVSIDLTRVGDVEFGSLLYNSQQAPVTRYYAWSFAHLFELNQKKAGIPVRNIPTVNRGEYYFPDSAAANVMFWKKGIANIVIGTVKGTRRKYNLDDLGNLLVETIEMNNY